MEVVNFLLKPLLNFAPHKALYTSFLVHILHNRMELQRKTETLNWVISHYVISFKTNSFLLVIGSSNCSPYHHLIYIINHLGNSCFIPSLILLTFESLVAHASLYLNLTMITNYNLILSLVFFLAILPSQKATSVLNLSLTEVTSLDMFFLMKMWAFVSWEFLFIHWFLNSSCRLSFLYFSYLAVLSVAHISTSYLHITT